MSTLSPKRSAKVLELREPSQAIRPLSGRAVARAYAGNGDLMPVVVKACKDYELVREMLCNVLARTLGIPAPFGMIVDVTNTIWGRNRIDLGECGPFTFATEWQGMDLRRAVRNNHEANMAVLAWPDVNRAAMFDEWIGNADRSPANLLFRGKGQFLLIDHEQALPDYLSPDTKVTNGLARLMKSAPGARGRTISLRERLLDGCQDFGQLDFNQVKNAALSDAWTNDGTFDECVRLLSDRLPYLPALVDEEVGTDQSHLNL